MGFRILPYKLLVLDLETVVWYPPSSFQSNSSLATAGDGHEPLQVCRQTLDPVWDEDGVSWRWWKWFGSWTIHPTRMVKARIKQWSICDGRCRSTIWFNAGHCPPTARLKKGIAKIENPEGGFGFLLGTCPDLPMLPGNCKGPKVLQSFAHQVTYFSITQLFLVCTLSVLTVLPQLPKQHQPTNPHKKIKTKLSCKRTLRTGACCQAVCSRIGYGPSNLRSGLRIPGVTGKKRQETIANRELEMASGSGRTPRSFPNCYVRFGPKGKSICSWYVEAKGCMSEVENALFARSYGFWFGIWNKKRLLIWLLWYKSDVKVIWCWCIKQLFCNNHWLLLCLFYSNRMVYRVCIGTQISLKITLCQVRIRGFLGGNSWRPIDR